MKAKILAETAKMIEHISNDPIASKVAAGLIVAILTGIFVWLLKRSRDRADSKKIYDFLQQSAQDGEYTFRSTHVIAAETKLSEQRVADLCSKHGKLERNRKESQTWRLK